MNAEQLARLKRIRRVTRLMDASLGIPGTRFKFGLDGLMGLVPGVGDVATAGISAWVIRESARLGVPARVIRKMAANLVVDLLVGAVPVAGDLFDFVWKANVRNLKLLEEHIASEEAALGSKVARLEGAPSPRR